MKLVSQLHTLIQITYSILSIYVVPPTDFNGKYVITDTEISPYPSKFLNNFRKIHPFGIIYNSKPYVYYLQLYSKSI
jgi:hypothetical protein